MSKGWDDLADLIHAKEEDLANNNLMLLDGTNASFRYLQRPNYTNFTDDYIRTVTSLGNSYKAKRIICLFDSGASVYRKSIFPEYKDNRKIERTEEEQERFSKFFECLTHTIESLPFEYYQFKGLEADDSIAYFVKNLAKKYDHTWIISSDKDLYQLLSSNVSIFNLYSRKEITSKSLYDDSGLTPEEYLVAKYIQGDSGDNIKGIDGIGPKRSTEIVKNYKSLQNLIDSLPIAGKSKYIQNLNNGKDLLIRNERLINLISYHMDAINSVDNADHINSLLQKALNK